MLRKGHILVILLIGVSITTFLSISAQQNYDIPAWVKGVAGYWTEDKITDNDFGEAISFLIEQGIIKVDMSQQANSEELDRKTSQLESENTILRSENAKLRSENTVLKNKIPNNNSNIDSPFEMTIINTGVPKGYPDQISVKYSVYSNHNQEKSIKIQLIGKDSDNNVIDIETSRIATIPQRTIYGAIWIDYDPRITEYIIEPVG